MRKRRNDYVTARNRAHLSNVLYTAKRPAVTEKDLELPGENNSFFSKVKNLFTQAKEAFFRLRRGPSLTPHKNDKKDESVIPSHTHTHQKSTGFLRESKVFYIVVVFCCVFLIGGAVGFASGLSDAGLYTVNVNDNGRKFSAKTEERTVEAFFKHNGIIIGENDVVDVSLTDPVEDNMEIVIRRAMPITIVNGTEEISISMLVGTVEEALERAKVDLGKKDEVYPTLDTYVTANMKINVIRVEAETIVEEEILHYKEITKNDKTLAKGKTKVVTKGKNGLQENTIEVVYKNGEEVSRTLVKEEVVKKPVNEVVHIGTYVAPKKTDNGGQTNNNNGNSTPSGTVDGFKVNSEGQVVATPSLSLIHSGTLYEHKNAPKPDESIIKKTVVINHVTAYCIKGNRTATGTWPKVGTIAADPKRFPYGTKVYVPGYGYGVVEDTGGFRNESRTVFDLWMSSRSDALNWGRKYDLKVYILK